MYKQVALLGTPIDVVTMADTLGIIESFIEDGEPHQIATANTDFLVNALRDTELRTILAQCDLIVPDGMPLLWASRLMGVRMPQRVTGADLVPQLGEKSAQKGWSLFLLGGAPEASLRAERELRRRYPAVSIAGRLSPPMAPLEKMNHEEILTEVRRARPDILLVAFGSPKQEKWIYRHRAELNVPVAIGVGAAFDFLGGSVPRAPEWMQHTGLEWLHRLITEPRRLGKRYLIDALQFSRYLSLQLLGSGFLGPKGEPFRIVRCDLPQQTIFRIRGRMSETQLARFGEQCREALKPWRRVIVDLAAAPVIGADAMAVLMSLQRRASRRNGQLILTGLTPRLQRMLRLSQAGSQFCTAPDVVEAMADPASGIAQLRLDLTREPIVCHLEGELADGQARLVREVCEQLASSFSNIRINTDGLTGPARATFANIGARRANRAGSPA